MQTLFDVGECHLKGFNVETLQCSNCDELNNFHLDNLMNDCKGCCSSDNDDANQQQEVDFLKFSSCTTFSKLLIC